MLKSLLRRGMLDKWNCFLELWRLAMSFRSVQSDFHVHVSWWKHMPLARAFDWHSGANSGLRRVAAYSGQNSSTCSRDSQRLRPRYKQGRQAVRKLQPWLARTSPPRRPCPPQSHLAICLETELGCDLGCMKVLMAWRPSIVHGPGL